MPILIIAFSACLAPLASLISYDVSIYIGQLIRGHITVSDFLNKDCIANKAFSFYAIFGQYTLPAIVTHNFQEDIHFKSSDAAYIPV